jgi:hypothetical protein
MRREFKTKKCTGTKNPSQGTRNGSRRLKKSGGFYIQLLSLLVPKKDLLVYACCYVCSIICHCVTRKGCGILILGKEIEIFAICILFLSWLTCVFVFFVSCLIPFPVFHCSSSHFLSTTTGDNFLLVLAQRAAKVLPLHKEKFSCFQQTKRDAYEVLGEGKFSATQS